MNDSHKSELRSERLSLAGHLVSLLFFHHHKLGAVTEC